MGTTKAPVTRKTTTKAPAPVVAAQAGALIATAPVTSAQQVPAAAAAPSPEVVQGAAQADAVIKDETAAQPDAPEAPAQISDPSHLRVIALADRFYRARRAFGREPVEIPLAELSADDLKAIEDERMLVATRVRLEGEE